MCLSESHGSCFRICTLEKIGSLLFGIKLMDFLCILGIIMRYINLSVQEASEMPELRTGKNCVLNYWGYNIR
jgi:hypothetical protein